MVPVSPRVLLLWSLGWSDPLSPHCLAAMKAKLVTPEQWEGVMAPSPTSWAKVRSPGAGVAQDMGVLL